VAAANGGFYRSLDNTIYWDERGYPDLAVVESGGSGSVTFTLSPLAVATNNQSITNPLITAEVTVRGKRMSDANVPEEIKSVMSQNVRVESEAQVAARSVFFVGPFVNTGPYPPKVEQETTFTVIYTITNTSNTITDARVRGVLPPYVNWYGSVFPSNENITYNKSTNEVIWLPGDIPAGTGIGKQPPREVAFQVVLQPSLSQVGTVPILVSDISFDAIDTFTNTPVSKTIKEVTANLLSDPKATGSDQTVVE
jgi:hypothetical protein